MQFENQSISLWFGTPDTPAPGETVPAGTEATITIAVQPADASNRVELLYRVKQGPTQTVPAKWLRSHSGNNAHYFKARFPAFAAGDTVEYTVICRCAGRQVPSKEEATQFAASFRVTELEEKLNAASKSQLGSSFARAAPGLAEVSQTIPPVDIAANKDVPVRSLMASHAARAIKDDASLTPAVNEAVAKLSDTTTVGDLLGLDQPLKEHPLFQPVVRNEAQKAALSSLLGTAPNVAASHLQDQFLSLYAKHEGPIEAFWSELRQNPDFGTKAVDELQLTLQLGALTQNHTSLIQELQRTYPVTSMRDLASLDVAAWTALVSQQTVGVPPDVPGATPQEKAANYVKGIVGVLQTAFPTDVVAQIVAKTPAIHFDDPTRQVVSRFFTNSSDFDLRTTHVDTYVTERAATAFNGIEDSDKPKVVKQVKRLQRVFQVSTGPEVMARLLVMGMDSAHQITNVSEETFVRQFITTPADEALARETYAKAEHISAATLNLHTMIMDAVSGARFRVIGDQGEGVKDAVIRSIPSYRELFGSIDLCECHHCRSVYGPAAYLVDLLHFLEPQPRNGKASPLEILLERRPDLEHLKLTCENTNTEIPYVDLVNEILEYSVAHGALDANAAHDTGDSSVEELSAAPQFTEEAAYTPLETAVYPLTLPFDSHLELARTYLENLGSRRYEVLTAFRKDDQGTRTSASIASEYLEISEEEFEVLTGMQFDGASPTVSRSLRGFYGYAESDFTPTLQLGASGAAVAALQEKLNGAGVNPILEVDGKFNKETEAAVTTFQQSRSLNPNGIVGPETWTALQGIGLAPLEAFLGYVPELLERGGLTYLEFVEALTTRFINLGHHVYEFLERNGVGYPDLVDLVNSGFTTLNSRINAALPGLGMDAASFVKLAKGSFKNIGQVIVLTSPDAGCDLSTTRLRRLDGTAVGEAIWDRLHRLIRLWRKLGTTMLDTDRILTALGTGEINMNFILTLEPCMRFLHASKLPLPQTLSLWGGIDTQGDDSLYRSLFLTRAAQKLDDSFMLNPARSELSIAGPNLRISDHIPALLAAFRLTEADLATIRQDAGLAAGDAPLTLANISQLYRYAVLARASQLTVSDLLALKTLSGLNPFRPSVNAPALPLRFLEIVEEVRGSSFSIRQLNYLYRHMTTPGAAMAPEHETVLLLIRALRDGLTKIADDHVPADGPPGELIRNKLGIIFESAVVDQTIRMMDGSAVYSALLATLPAAIAKLASSNNVIGIDRDKLPGSVKNRITYDTTTKALRFTGTMTTADRNILLALPNIALPADKGYANAIEDLFQQPRDILTNVLSGVLDLSDQTPQGAHSRLLETASLDTENQPLVTVITGKFAYFLEKLLPYLRDRLSRVLIKQTIGDALGLDGVMCEALLEQLDTKSTMADCLALSMSGLSGAYFSDPQLAISMSVRIDKTIAFDGGGTTLETTIPPGTGSARWTGMFRAPNNGEYTFGILTFGGVRLWIGNDQQPIIDEPPTPPTPGQPPPELSNRTRITLKAGELYEVRLEVFQLPANNPASAIVELRWSGPSTPRDILPSSHLYPRGVIDSFVTSFTLLQKIALLVNGFQMTDREVSYLSSHSTDFSNFDLKALPLDRSNPTQTDQKAVGLFQQWRRLNDFIALRNSVPPGEVSLVDVFGATSLDDAKSKVARVSGWDPHIVDALAGASGFNLAAADFKNEIGLIRLQTCVRLVTRLGVSADKLLSWAGGRPDAKQAQEIKDTVRARYSEPEWPTVAKSLNDALRERRRTVLVAFLLADPRTRDKGIGDASRLYEYFLIDVDMGACMATSRIKQAISSVQLFIQRCLMNLEPQVNPRLIDAEQWQWMKHYRIWEANRKVFLYPENWIEPELRDDKTPFFKTLEKDLLQSDLTTQSAETAIRTYLDSLNAVARLDIRALCLQQETDPITGRETNLLHVFARTIQGQPKTYYYRRLENNTNWTPWEKLNVDIEGDQLTPVIWNNRLYLFWPLYDEKPDTDQTTQADVSRAEAEKRLQEWETAHAKWQQDHDKWFTDHQQWRQDHDKWEEAHRIHQEWERQLVVTVTIYNPFGPDVTILQSDPGPEPPNPKEPLEPQPPIEPVKPPNPNPSVPHPPRTHIEAKLAWSEYRQGTWLPKRLSSDADRLLITLPPFQFRLVAQTNGDGLDILFMPPAKLISLTIPPYRNIASAKPIGMFRFTNCHGPVKKHGETEVGESLGYPVTFVFTISTFLSVGNVNSGSPSSNVLEHLPSHPILSFPQIGPYDGQEPFFYADDERTYFVTSRGIEDPIQKIINRNAVTVSAALGDSGATPSPRDSPLGLRALAAGPVRPVGPTALFEPAWGRMATDASGRPSAPDAINLRFSTHFHPHVCDFIEALNRGGVDALLTTDTQRLADPFFTSALVGGTFLPPSAFRWYYEPTSRVDRPYPSEDVGFSGTNAYSLYNWELFFHAPLLIATRLSTNDRYEEAERWFRYIFDPTSDSAEPSPGRYWRTRPFKSADVQGIQTLLDALSAPDGSPGKVELVAQVEAWRRSPFDPHLIARMRPVAYMKNVVMKYLDHLIAWGDHLFRQDTIESINEAALLYVLVSELLGPRPQRIPPHREVKPQTYATLRPDLDAFSNALVELELQFSGVAAAPGGSPGVRTGLGVVRTLYFCTPQNDKMLGYWDTIADRLFKIRHCMNIEGIERVLPLFEPPIDPALLVQAVARGQDLGSVLDDISAPVPYYRFSYFLARALELCADLKSLGAALLSALEKQDAERLATLRASHETALLNLQREVRKQQLFEAQAARETLDKTRDVTNTRYEFYSNIVDRLPHESGQLTELETAKGLQGESQASESVASDIATYTPDLSVGVAGQGPYLAATLGRGNIIAYYQALSRQNGYNASVHTYSANRMSILGNWTRRQDDWTLQRQLASKELIQIDKQIAAAEIRIAIAERELLNHERQIEQSKRVEEFLRTKYTNEELYGWMISQVLAVYSECYKMAYDLAKCAEKAYRFERGVTTSNFIRFGSWDSARKGLLAGERLYLALKQIEKAYLDQNRREYEITKHISLMLHAPLALITQSLQVE